MNLMHTGSASFAPGAAVAEMVTAIWLDEQRVLPVVACLQGEYGTQHVSIGVPAVIGAQGVECVLDVELNAQEQATFASSVVAVRSLIASVADSCLP